MAAEGTFCQERIKKLAGKCPLPDGGCSVCGCNVDRRHEALWRVLQAGFEEHVRVQFEFLFGEEGVHDRLSDGRGGGDGRG
ncbi:hypothetical protein [Streptomyces sp. NBC_01465]|uniref:hypothetical protein n=1 Tax=Streptomyces sp. NBC_01465 TaxID=2903878 RepID=UPI002E2F5A88|nr:hypothetical protein [Streptomyces sp. NBC_01465]